VTKSFRKRWPLFRFLGSTFGTNFVLPTPKLLLLVLLGCLIAPIGLIWGNDLRFFWVYNGLLVLLSIVDLGLLPRRKEWEISRSLPERADMKQIIPVTIHLLNRGKRDVIADIKDDLPLVFISGDYANLSNIKVSSEEKNVQYTIYSLARGKYTLAYLYLRYRGSYGLWSKQLRIEQLQEIRIFPDLSGVRGILGSLQESLVVDGTRIYRRNKTGSDFASIREYTVDDDPRMINWTATARSSKLMTSVFQPERGKILTILLDCGRMMGVELDGRIKLDRTLEAAMTLAAVALKQGEQVAVLAFSNTLKAYVPPGRGLPHLQVILEAVYDLKSDPEEASYSMALEHILRYQRKRSLLILFSEMENLMFEDTLMPFLMRMRRVHLVLLITLQDPILAQWSKNEIKDSRSAFIKSTALRIMLDRKNYVQHMTNKGIEVLDVAADHLALVAVNYYLDIKAREAL
jgi:uncharacterized protein (DUF58 family)